MIYWHLCCVLGKIDALEDKILKYEMDLNESKKGNEERVMQIAMLEKRIKEKEEMLELLKNNNNNSHFNSDINAGNDSISL